MNTRLVCGFGAALILFAGAAAAQDRQRSHKISTVQTFRSNKATPLWRGKSAVGSFTRGTASVLGGIGHYGVRTVNRSQATPATHAARGRLLKSSVITVYRRGTSAESNVASVEGETVKRDD